jgi:beta-lactamase class A
MKQAELQADLERLCAEFDGVAGVAAENLATSETVGVNEAVSFPTASMIKIVVLFELVRQCAKGQAQMWERLILRPEDKTRGSGLLIDFDEGARLTLRDLAVLMMAISDNTATNVLIDRLGIHAINIACREAGMYETELRGKIDFDRIRESNDNLAVTVPRDFARFLAALRRGELIPSGQVEQMLGIMRIQKYIEPLRKLLPHNPYSHEFGEAEEVWVASKTGSLQGARCEGGLIHTPHAEWCLCVMTKDSPDKTWTSDNEGVRFLSTVSRTVYDAWGGMSG